MIGVLVALRDFIVAILISWLGVVSEPTDTQAQTDATPTSQSATIALLR